MKALQCWWAPAAASLSVLARLHQLSDYQIILTAATTSNLGKKQQDRQTDAATDLDVSHTKCASLVTDAQCLIKKTLNLIIRGQ